MRDSKVQEKLDVVVIATLRPQILDVTLNSFYHGLLKDFDVRVIINVDPIGEFGVSQSDVIAVCKRYFKNVISNMPDTPSFSKAVFWCWEKVKTDIFFHLEDDWCLKYNLDKNLALKPFSNNNVIQVRLNSTRNNKFSYDNNYVIAEVFSLNPSFFRTKYIKEKLPGFDFDRDPEKQIRYNLNSHSFINPKLLFYGSQNQNRIIIMTGKIWREKHNFNKWIVSTTGDVTWNRKKINPFKQAYLNIKYRFYLWWWKIKFCKKLK